MTDYGKMYSILCLAASEALDALPDTPETQTGRNLLQTALNEAEEYYINPADSEDGIREAAFGPLV